MMSKITPGTGPAGNSGGQPGFGPGAGRETATGGVQFRSSVEQSRQSGEATAAGLQKREEHSPRPVDRDPPQRRKKPPVFETSQTVSLREALEIQGMNASLLSAGPHGTSGGVDLPGIAVITRDGAQPANSSAEPLLAFQTIFMDGNQYERWRTGAANPALTKTVGEMLSTVVNQTSQD
jgi:hypothetical protein